MKTQLLATLIALTFVAQACEVTRKPQDPALSGEQPTQADAPPIATPSNAPGKVRQVDGREKAPTAQSGPVMSMNRVRVYAFGSRPIDLEPKADSFEITPLTEPLAEPVKRPGVTVDRVVLEPSIAGWEPALLERGITLVDRESLRLLEREFFLQDAVADAPPSSCASCATPGSACNGCAAPKSPAPWSTTMEWQKYGERFYPRLSGRSIADSERLEHGRIVPASWLLQLEFLGLEEDRLVHRCDQPIASFVEYSAQVLGEVDLPALRGGKWTPSTEDPFLLEHSDGTVYFDPNSKSLWTLDRAWIGEQVSRGDYIRRRTTRTEPKCAECGRPQPSKATTTSPAPDSTPREWQCSTCAERYDVTYFDGYSDASLARDATQAIIHWRWVNPAPGIYPVLQPGRGASGSALLLAERDVRASTLLDQVAPEQMLGAEPVAWCVVSRGADALILKHQSMESLRRDLWPSAQDPKKLPLPATTVDGRQIFLPSTEPYREVLVEVPIASAAVQARLIRMEDSTIAMSGVLHLSYRNLLRSPVTIQVPDSGADLRGWPSIATQKRLLLADLQRRLAEYITK